MSRLLVRPVPEGAPGPRLEVTPQSAGWRHVGFRLHRLAPGEALEGGDVDREACLVLVSGAAVVTAGDTVFGRLGGRASPFDDQAPGAVYVPAGEAWRVVADSALELAICTAPGRTGGTARVIADADMPKEVRGKGSNTRHVRNILPESATADGLLVVEVITPSGNASSYPPHKHDMATPGEETALEETYYHRISPAQGFAFQRVYTDDRSIDETMCVQDGDLVMVPRGYHPVVAPHGYDVYYLNVMAGPERRWMFRNDPAHEWMLKT